MCIVKTPKIETGTEKPKEPTIIRNPYLDGVDPTTKAARAGRSSLRIDRAGSQPAQLPATATPPASYSIPSRTSLPPC